MVTKSKSRNTRWIWLATAIALLLVFYGVHLATRTKVPIRVAEATRGELRSTISTNGKVEPQVNFEAHAPFPGVVKQLYVHEGEQVKAGQLLVDMDDSDARAHVAAALATLRGAQSGYSDTLAGGTQEERISMNSDLTKAQMDRDQAQRSLATLEKLQLTGAASANEVNDAKQRLASADQSLASLQQRKTDRYSAGDVGRSKSTLEEAQAGYAAALDSLNQAHVRAPFDGTVYSLPVSRTEYVQQGDRLLQMANLEKMQVRGYFDEPEIGKLQEGQPITISWDARPNEIWHGSVSRVPSTIITYGTRNVGEVLVTLSDADGNLLPATNVRITVTTANESNALYIPREALHTEAGQDYVYRVDKDILHRVVVTIGNLNLTQVEIRNGLKDGDTVALSSTNGQPLGNRMPVTPVQ
ncbi:efflux RND transporter periplasmic adaptor subunit [Silvibacterium dinghuense]|uniref:Efflux RND transporter periplasmic adaptor subunit n=1 Tax=Silvibacterium dinghuense TaxID=1560006 RepID=A0A4Q1SDY6_9BACT|nr:efflux RND transporter periplasmic adaptor subunit [Silvibacterium dinghuense]RXS95295.1 efflux RND transporter periplasmic adaptor subunit [Silvibacterium dinghuense]GGH12217.1 secretion protein HlyD [Silvibacterium dinghuense]